MEIFRTTFTIPPSSTKITFKSPIIFMGSCFSGYIGQKLSDVKFIADNNPFGIVYNPLSLKSGLERLLSGKLYEKNELFNHEGIWGSFDHHSRFSDIAPEVSLDRINSRMEYSSEFIRSAKFIFITFGTSYVYTLRKSGKIVSNCHKYPASEFIRTRLTVEQIASEYITLLHQIKAINQDLEVVFTVSPVRHWKDGAQDNQLSKAILLLAVNEICKVIPNTFYFPSYEIVMDDLRDYRFYEEDMLHPNKIAINYIWSRFRECFFANDTIILMKEVEKVLQAVLHRPFNPKSEQYQNFILQTLDKINFLKDQYGISFIEEERKFLDMRS